MLFITLFRAKLNLIILLTKIFSVCFDYLVGIIMIEMSQLSSHNFDKFISLFIRVEC